MNYRVLAVYSIVKRECVSLLNLVNVRTEIK